MKIYLASPLFTQYERQKVKEWAARLRGCGRSVYVPMEHSIENAWELPNCEWAKKVFDEDIKAIQEADEVYCIYYGLYSDSGTAWECGYAYALGKPVRLIDESNEEVSLMVVNGARNWDDFRYKNQT